MPGLGISFVPGQESMGGQPGSGGGPAAPSAALQRAIQLLSLRLPRFGMAGGPGQLAPTQLLQGMGSAGLSPDLLAALLQGSAPSGGFSGGPQIIPGGEPDRMLVPPDPPVQNGGILSAGPITPPGGGGAGYGNIQTIGGGSRGSRGPRFSGY